MTKAEIDDDGDEGDAIDEGEMSGDEEYAELVSWITSFMEISADMG
jgi:hypothetical protein